jgi:micrococcal nuclease
MKSLFAAALLILPLFPGYLGNHYSPPAVLSDIVKIPEPAYTYRAVVVRVIDGDTVVLDIDLGFDTWLHNKHIRLLGVDAPEIRGAERAEGLKWKARLEAQLPTGAEVILQSTKDKSDKYGRYLGTLWSQDLKVN